VGTPMELINLPGLGMVVHVIDATTVVIEYLHVLSKTIA
jgi:hypothetical protein